MPETTDVLATERAISLDDPSLYLNSDLSLLAFQRRVLEEAQDPRNPLLERTKFLSIVFSNLDEFFMVHVARLIQHVESHNDEIGPDGRTALSTLESVRAEVTKIVAEAYALFNGPLTSALADAGIVLTSYSQLNGAQQKFADDYFRKTVFPVLTPLAFDPGRPFPHISNLSFNIAVVAKKPGGREHFARVKVPNSLSQLVRLPFGKDDPTVAIFIWLDDLITAHNAMLFPGMEICAAQPFHVTRDAEVAIQELESEDLLETIEEAVWARRFRDVVRLQIRTEMPSDILDVLTTNLNVEPNEVYRVNGPIDLGRIKDLNLERPELKYKPYVPVLPKGLRVKGKQDIFARIQRGDILMHQPYDSFQPVIDFLNRAARDPDVMAIKATLYRVGKNSPVVRALLDAVENGKQVAVLVELKARFDEESNIEWAKALEDEGVHVVYGLPGIKVHSKVMLVVRREGEIMRRYMHLGTGNYNAVTARLYTDLGLFTCDDAIGADVSDLFNYLTGYSVEHHYRKLLVAPINMRDRLTELIEREIMHQTRDGEGHLIFKMNALEDPGMIKLLYKASQAGVKLDLLVRGICCLRPGVAGISENIRVISIVGRYLEHSRIYYFRNAGQEEIYLGSADLMPRNLNRRVEVLFPVQDPALKERITKGILAAYFADRAEARLMQSDDSYTRLRSESATGQPNAQEWFMQHHELPYRG